MVPYFLFSQDLFRVLSGIRGPNPEVQSGSISTMIVEQFLKESVTTAVKWFFGLRQTAVLGVIYEYLVCTYRLTAVALMTLGNLIRRIV